MKVQLLVENTHTCQVGKVQKKEISLFAKEGDFTRNHSTIIILSINIQILVKILKTIRYSVLIVPRFCESVGTLNLIRLSVRPSVPTSVRPSVCHKNFNLAHIFWSIKDRALIFGMHDPCDKPFQVMPSRDLDLEPSSRSKLLPSGGPQFSEFAFMA